MTNNKNNRQGRLIAADFFSYTLKAFLIGVATSAVLSGGVVLLAQAAAQDESSSINETPQIVETP
ncbi:MAG: hypothetical protein ACKVQK_03615 [Burkholderiales bacterium]